MTPLEKMKEAAELCNKAMKRATGSGMNFSDKRVGRSYDAVQQRRKDVLSLHEQGIPKIRIAAILGIDRGTVIRDLKYMGITNAKS
jgi:DNA invertase Pin-like site-specific DNA recombinase